MIASKKIVLILAGLSLLIKLAYFQLDKNYILLPNDVPEHIEYIKQIVKKSSLPVPLDCIECYQPPLYYLSAALIYNLTNFFSGSFGVDPLRAVQLYSLALFFIFQLIGVKVMRDILGNNKKFLIAAALFLFWPSGTIHSLRIANDGAAYLFIMLCLFFANKWWKSSNFKYLFLATISTSIGLQIKSTALPMVGVIILAVVLKYVINKKVHLQPVKTALLILILVLALGLNRIHNLLGSPQDDPFVGNITRVNQQPYLLKNEPKNFLFFDFKAYTVYPAIIPDRDQSGRQFFANILLKSSLFPELSYRSTGQKYPAIILSYLLLFFLLLFFASIIKFKQRQFLSNFPLLAMVALYLISAIIFRYLYPYSSSADFRYIYPVLVPFLLLIVESANQIKSEILRRICLFSFFLFIFLSSIYFLLPLMSSPGVLTSFF